LARHLPPGGFLHAAAGLGAASALAMAIGLVAAPALTRLFDPAEIGAVALFSSVAGLLGIVAGGRWHLAFAPASRAERAALLSLTLAIASIFAAFATLAAWPLGPALARSVGTARAFWVWLAPAGAALMAANQALRWLAVAEGQPNRAAKALVVRPAVAATCQIAAGLAGADEAGLILGALAGWLAADLLLLNGRRLERSADRVIEAARTWRRYPAQALPAALATQAVIALPEFYIAARHGAVDVGLYSMVVRFLAAPVVVLAEAVSALWWRRAATLPPGPALVRRFDRLVIGLSLPALAGVLLVIVFGPAIFGRMLGPHWLRAGALAQLIAPYHGLRLVSAPVLATGAALGRPGTAAAWSGLDLGIAIAACAAGVALHLPLESWLTVYSALGTASRIGLIVLMRRQAAGDA
jgi:O-antigen/teichoic acid export membrane protein